MDAVVDTGLSHGTVIGQVGRRRARRWPRHTLGGGWGAGWGAYLVPSSTCAGTEV